MLKTPVDHVIPFREWQYQVDLREAFLYHWSASDIDIEGVDPSMSWNGLYMPYRNMIYLIQHPALFKPRRVTSSTYQAVAELQVVRRAPDSDI